MNAAKSEIAEPPSIPLAICVNSTTTIDAELIANAWGEFKCKPIR